MLFTSVIDRESEVGPTLMVILTALLCEYLELSPISPAELLHGLAGRLSSYSGTSISAHELTMRTKLVRHSVHAGRNSGHDAAHLRRVR